MVTPRSDTQWRLERLHETGFHVVGIYWNRRQAEMVQAKIAEMHPQAVTRIIVEPAIKRTGDNGLSSNR